MPLLSLLRKEILLVRYKYIIYFVIILLFHYNMHTYPLELILFCLSTEILNAPVNVMVRNITATAVTLSWTAPVSLNAIIRYDLVFTEEQFVLPTLQARATGTSVTVYGLKEYSTYAVKVAAVSRSKVGTFSALINFTTLESGMISK